MNSTISPRNPGHVQGPSRRLPLLALTVLPFTFAEFLTGSTPLLSLVRFPLSIVFLFGLYGSGVLLVRESVVRWNKGWIAVLCLGGAYGIIEEGLALKTFFDIREVGFSRAYGHWLGINWVWAVDGTIFHAVFTVALPILLVSLAFPSTRGLRVTTDREYVSVVVIFLATVLTLFFTFDPGYSLSPYLLALTLLVVLSLGALGCYLPTHLLAPTSQLPLVSPTSFGILGAAFGWSFFAIYFAGPALAINPLVLVTLTVLLSIGVLTYLRARVGRVHQEVHQVVYAGGVLSPLLFMGLLLGIYGDLPVLAVVAAVLAFLTYLALRISRTPG